MKNKDKILMGFLVTAGLFSLAQAGEYVRQLTDVQKTQLVQFADSGAEATVEPPRVVEKNRLG
jgi:hypothetical protein